MFLNNDEPAAEIICDQMKDYMMILIGELGGIFEDKFLRHILRYFLEFIYQFSESKCTFQAGFRKEKQQNIHRQRPVVI
jgi:hypothetical protein